jgi:DNA-binding beta-propeller fold protein YncE
MRYCVAALLSLAACSARSGANGDAGAAGADLARSSSDGAAGALDGAVLYVTADDGTLFAFQVGSWAPVGKWSGLPFTDGVRGIDADAQAGVLYVAHGGDDSASSGSLFAWSLTQQTMLYNRTFNHGIDQFAVGGGRIYMPAGELANSTTWYVLDAADASQVGTETGGSYPHNTIFQNGHRYYGGRQSNSLVVLGIGAGTVGPSPSSQAGVRPFTVNAAETRVWITWTHYRGFSVGNVATGAILASVDFGPVPGSYSPTAASHGISLAPDGSELYVLDTPNNAARVYDSSDAPQLKSTITLQRAIFPGNESPCAYDCAKDGWLLHSRSGRYVYVGDSGDVIDTQTHQVTANVDPLRNNRHGFIEIEWAGGVPTATSTHFGRGY